MLDEFTTWDQRTCHLQRKVQRTHCSRYALKGQGGTGRSRWLLSAAGDWWQELLPQNWTPWCQKKWWDSRWKRQSQTQEQSWIWITVAHVNRTQHCYCFTFIHLGPLSKNKSSDLALSRITSGKHIRHLASYHFLRGHLTHSIFPNLGTCPQWDALNILH